jgi:hypothetical protein
MTHHLFGISSSLFILFTYYSYYYLIIIESSQLGSAPSMEAYCETAQMDPNFDHLQFLQTRSTRAWQISWEYNKNPIVIP